MSKRKIYLLTIWTVTGLVILLSLAFRIFGWRGSKVLGSIKNMDGRNVIYDGKNSYSFTVDDKVEAIEVESNVANINIIKGNSFVVKAYYSEDALKPLCDVQDKVLRVEQAVKKISPGFGSRCEITIEVPRQLDKLEVKSSVGNVKIKDVNCKETDVNSDVGNVSVKGGSHDALAADTDTGNVDIQDVSFTNADISSDVGNVELKLTAAHKASNPSMDLSTELGTVKVFGEKKSHSYTSAGSSSRLSAKTDLGNVRIE